MHANRKTGNEKEDRELRNDRAETMGLDHVGSGGSHGTGNVLDRFPGATLTERVVGFLERYNKSFYGL